LHKLHFFKVACTGHRVHCGCPWSSVCDWHLGRAGLGCSSHGEFHWVHILIPLGFLFGYYLDKKGDEKLTVFLNKSTLYRRELRPNEEVN
ncbi:NADH dehydrogenase [ubiquinone] 1 beta subcomplex subunit 1-like, partial [Perognathus longimembris pacificus]|uniref:NADH dehydrogenase [ubiquinone] 1 beta subcomplex subunit 1-like n=1 Tax=Perognathus longimembris pacificus TaxID=214514 RepID=UPI002018B754